MNDEKEAARTCQILRSWQAVSEIMGILHHWWFLYKLSHTFNPPRRCIHRQQYLGQLCNQDPVLRTQTAFRLARCPKKGLGWKEFRSS
jgi:hypothetical protein